MRSDAKAKLHRLFTGPGLIRLLLVMLAIPPMLLGAAVAAALACVLAPLALVGLSIKGLLRPGRPATLQTYPDISG
jgi:hypothetical protein